MQENTQEKSRIKQRILLYLQKKGVSEYSFYKKSSITRGILQQNNGISEENIARFLAYAPDVNLEWLLTGEGEMLRQTSKPEAIVAPTTLISTNKGTERTSRPLHEATKMSPGAIPLVSEQAVGGFSNEHFSISERDVIAYYTIPKFRHLGVDFMIEIVGDSMMPRLFPGDIIACSIIYNPHFIQWNKPHLLATREQGLIVKRLRRSAKEDCLLAVSDNTDYDPFDIPKDEIVGIARIVGVIHLE